MNFARELLRELVDKRLWPIAAVLVAALVALPLLLAGGGDAGAPPIGAGAAAGGAGKQVTALELTAPPSARARPGKVRNPFRRPAGKAAAAAAAAPAASTPSGAAPSQPTNAPGSPAPPAPPSGTPAPQPTTTTPAPAATKPQSAYLRTTVRWYRGTKLGRALPISRLTPLGGLTDPGALYLGNVATDGLYAVFLLGPSATAVGKTGCVDGGCRLLALKAGERQKVVIRPFGRRAARRYTLQVLHIDPVAADSSTARRMRLKVHPDGRDAMRAAWQDSATAKLLATLEYDSTLGLLSAKPSRAAGKTSK